MRLDHDEFSCNAPTPVPSSSPKNVDGVHCLSQTALGHHLVKDDPVVDEFASAHELTRKIATSGLQNDAFLLANEDQLVANYNKWNTQFPKIQPYFDVASNACPWVLTSLDRMNVKFSCQSKAEIQHVLEQEIDSSKVFFAGHTKVGSHIKFANANNVSLMSFGSLGELKKIQTAMSKNEGSGQNKAMTGLLLALQLPATTLNGTGNPETDSQCQWLDLLNAAKDLGFNVVGVSFFENHATSSAKVETKVNFNKMMALTKMAFTIGHSLGQPMKIIDVGMMNKNLSNGQEELEMALTKHLQNMEHELIGHLGTSFIENVFTCGAKIIGKRLGSYQNALVINEGIFNSFTRLLVDDDFQLHDIRPLKAKKSGKSRMSKAKKDAFDLYGSSGDDLDILVQDFVLDQDVDENDWLFFPMMGAYSYSIQSNMISVKLPKKLGNFRLFQAPGTPDIEDTDQNEVKIEDSENFGVDMLGHAENNDGLEVVFLDIQECNENAEKTCLDLFEELPNFTCQKFWGEEEEENFFSEFR